MAWDEWERLKAEAAADRPTGMRLNQLPVEGGESSAPGDPAKYGDLNVNQRDLAKIGKNAFDLYNDLWDQARQAVPSSEKAARTLTSRGLALGSALQHVATRWDEQLSSLMDACAHISNHMTVTKRLHAEDDHYIRRQMSSIDVLDAGFDERVGRPGPRNEIYGGPGGKQDTR
ncbi:hypothetical protein [Streptomyces sp. B93]|uniref:hypothetical protein n=1 Tax=Streptomyces sp. B93 TaxID=2824875 RepID=UPI001B35D601|nr:hypothetical protein [Streptomyces sp. B93]MBQ1093799.1 hypothetical protein [Streptomyces sp. B93]